MAVLQVASFIEVVEEGRLHGDCLLTNIHPGSIICAAIYCDNIMCCI